MLEVSRRNSYYLFLPRKKQKILHLHLPTTKSNLYGGVLDDVASWHWIAYSDGVVVAANVMACVVFATVVVVGNQTDPLYACV